MAGFLDSKERIIDMVLTNRGKLLLSNGVLQMVYWAAFDDEVDYDPVITESGTLDSGSLQARRTSKTEEPLTREATQGYKNFNKLSQDACNVNRALMTVPPGQAVVPSSSVDAARLIMRMQQQPVVQHFSQKDDGGNYIDPFTSTDGMGVFRFGSMPISITAEYSKESFPPEHKLDGFYVKVLQSGTDAYATQHHTLDENSEIVVGADLKIRAVTYGD